MCHRRLTLAHVRSNDQARSDSASNGDHGDVAGFQAPSQLSMLAGLGFARVHGGDIDMFGLAGLERFHFVGLIWCHHGVGDIVLDSCPLGAGTTGSLSPRPREDIEIQNRVTVSMATQSHRCLSLHGFISLANAGGRVRTFEA